MTKRTYHQYCPVAYMLDIVGERWTLLLVRELSLGPRRFTDLLNGLPGIGSNLLSQRLKRLEEAGLIKQRTLPPPAGSTVYELTETGSALKEVLGVLAKNGLKYLQIPPPEDDNIGVISTMITTKRMFNSAKAGDVKIACEIHVSDEIFYAEVQGGEIEVDQGTLKSPDLVLSTDPRT
ncbi:MAG: helix-turn-helix domain-containing protein, partial [Anaerolineae bacterium]|nr:helix-turn-helix domain-containing protein [Anaerolineae bacterium]